MKSSEEPQTVADLEHILLQNRGLKDNAEITEFFSPKLPQKLSLSEVGINNEQMTLALRRLQIAKEKKEDVLIFGDYDADGVCATAILWQGLKEFGIIARPFIPHREKHGYGLSLRSLEAILAEKKPDLVITVDNGIVAHEAFARLKELGIDAILTDHHQPDKKLGFPSATVVLHTTQLCGSTVAWFFSRELNKEHPNVAEDCLDLCAIATVADQVPLFHANRSFVVHGLNMLRQNKRIGLQVLLAKTGLDPKTIETGTINFGIAPRINAMGRLKHGLDALRLLCTKNLQRADELVAKLSETNILRQEMTEKMIQDALLQADRWKDQHIIIVDSPDYHEGVIGLIAGKLMEKFGKPAIVVARGETLAKASARSVAGVNVVEFIRLIRDDLLEVGGHPMAAGFGFLPEKMDVVRARLETLAKEKIAKELLLPSIEVECALDTHFISPDTLVMIEKFAPFGQGNREPVFGFKNFTIAHATKMGRDEKHLKLALMSEDKKTYIAIAWNRGALADELKINQRVDIAAALQKNEWNGKKTVQILIKDMTNPHL